MRARHLIRHLIEPAAGTTRRIPVGLARGVRLTAEPAATASADLWVGLFESELAPFVRRLAQPGVRAIDVGANAGYYALTLAARCRAPVLAFEPDGAARERLAANLALNPELAGFVEVRTEAVGAASSAGVVALDDVLTCASHGPLTVVPGLLKIDVDGPEVDVLLGARRLLTERRPHVIVETHSAASEERCAELLLEVGYRPRVVTPRRLLPQDRTLAHNRWLVGEGRSTTAG